MTNEESILNSITPQLKSAVKWSNSHIANKQEQALKHYKREALPGDDKIKGKSKWVSPKVQQHIDWLSGQLIRIFDAPENVVEFCGVGPEDEAIARQQTQVVNWILKTKNSHGAYLQPWIQNGLLTGLGVVTAEFETYTEESLPRLLKSVPNETLVSLYEEEQAGHIIIEELGKAQTQPGPMGIVETRDVKVRTVKRIPCFNILSVAPEDFIVSKDAKFDNETGGIAAKIQGHRKTCTKADLIEWGYDAKKVNALPDASDKTDGIALERSKDLAGEQGVGPDDVEVYTVYTKIKAGKDEKARHYRLTIGGDLENRPVLLDYTEVSKFYPYAAFCPFPIADTLFSLGVADRLADDHILITRMYRNVLDNLSLHVNPIKIVNPDTTNIDDLLNSHAGQIVRSQDPTGGISFNVPPFAGADAIPVIDQLSQSLEFSTGTGPTMIGVNAEDFQRTSATAANLRSNASQLLIENTSRFFADTGYKYLVKIVVDLLIQKPDEAAELVSRLTNQAIPLDEFSTDYDVATSVAFGVMSRDQSAAQLTNILNHQMQLLGTPIVAHQQVYATLAKLAETTGFKNTALFFTDPSTLEEPPPPPPPVDPNAGLIEMERVKAQLEAQAADADRQFQMAKLAAQQDFERDKMAQDFALQKAEIEARYAAQVEVERLKLEQSMPRDPMGNFQ
ncbi:portal protein [Sinorhizobium meliloti]|uniref:portal protein n=1 Tax=Rhizobium meliloti TaxID=382 RepID=UPI003D64C232